jgi:hypothetical protein
LAGKGNHHPPCVQPFGVNTKDDQNWPLKVNGKKAGLFKGGFVSGQSSPSDLVNLNISLNKNWPLKVDGMIEGHLEVIFISS